MRPWCVAAILIIATTSAEAASVAGGVGVRTCGQFAKDYQNNPANAEIIYNNWALGFMSGMNAAIQAADKPPRDLEAISFEEKKRCMRDYCDAHPLQVYLGGVIEMMGSLPLIPGGQTK